MAVYIDALEIDSFRGLRKLEAGDLNHINLIVGDNNCGKTSVLEAIQLLRNPIDFANLLRVARQRESYLSLSRTSPFESFSNLFPSSGDRAFLHVAARCRGEIMECVLDGEWREILLEREDRLASYWMEESGWSSNKKPQAPAEVLSFSGELISCLAGIWERTPVTFHEQSKIGGMPLRKNESLKMSYLSPVDHMGGYVLNRIVRDGNYKDLCLRVIQLFDPDIIDLLILKNEQTNRPVEYIGHRTLGNMPVSTYGDGVKKVLLLANAIAQTTGGVLLIDEIETSIHARYYDDIFRFVIKACRQFDIQLFITTHSMETVDALLSAQDYDRNGGREDVTVLTLKKTPERTLARIMPGREVIRNRDAFDFEVRL